MVTGTELLSEWINAGRAMSAPVVRSRNVRKRNSMRFVTAFLAVLASFVGGPNAAVHAAPQAPKDAQPFFQRAQAIAAPYIKAGKRHRFSGSEAS
jgi:hypothetical protein